jgi:Tol biopolymer transport system component
MYEFWVASADGLGRTRVGEGIQAQWSPGGTRVYITDTGGDCIPRLTSVMPDGTDAQAMPFDLRVGDGPFWWAPDGRHVAFMRYRDAVPCPYASVDVPSEPWVMNADGSEQHRLAESGWPTWAPEGERLVLLGRSVAPVGGYISAPTTDVLSVVDLAGTVLATIGPDARVVYDAPAWSPDGTRLAFGRWEGKLYAQVVVANADLTSLSPLTLAADEAFPGGQEWSPDGRVLLFLGTNNDEPDAWRPALWIVDTDGRDPRRLSPAGAFELAATWSPSGTSIAVTRVGSAPGGLTPGILVLDTLGSTLAELGAGGYPSWQPVLRPLLDAR